MSLVRGTRLAASVVGRCSASNYAAPANKLQNEQELADAVANWRRPYSAGPLTEEELEQFWTDGYVLKENILADEDLQPSIDAINVRKSVFA
jgi:hypothetical protein